MTQATKAREAHRAARKAKRKEARRKPDPQKFNCADHGTEERWQHGRMDLVFPPETSSPGFKVARDQWVRQIDRLNERGQISNRKHEAARCLYRDFLKSGLHKSTVPPYDGGGGGAKGRKYGKRPAAPYGPYKGAKSDYATALVSLPNTQADVVRRVVIDDVLPTRAALETLQDGLAQLADYYHLEPERV